MSWVECGNQQKQDKPPRQRTLFDRFIKTVVVIVAYVVSAFAFWLAYWAFSTSPTRSIVYSLTDTNMLVIPKLTDKCLRMSEDGFIGNKPNKDGSSVLTVEHKAVYTCNSKFIWKDERDTIERNIKANKP